MQKSVKASWCKAAVMALCMAALLAALCGCGGDKTPTDQQTSLGTGTAWQKVADVKGLELILDEKSGEDRAQVPSFVNADDEEGLDKLNKALQGKADYYRDWLETHTEDDGWVEVKPLVIDTDNYLSVVLFEAEWPNYGTDGEASSYVWDKISHSVVKEDLAWALAGATDDGIAAALDEYVENTLSDGDREYKWIEFYTPGYYIDADDKAALIVQTKTKLEGGDDWYYLLVYKDGKIIGNLSWDLK